MAHYENETKAHDGNDDGFVDIPQVCLLYASRVMIEIVGGSEIEYKQEKYVYEEQI